MNPEVQAAFNALSLAPSVTLQELESAYRDLAQVWHPDRFQHNARLQAKAQKQFCTIREAYDIARAFIESGRPDDPSPRRHDNHSKREPSTPTPTLLDLCDQIRGWFLASNVGAGPISVFIAWLLGSIALASMCIFLAMSWDFFGWTGPSFERPGIVQLFTIALAATTMSRLATAINTRMGYWAVRAANLLPLGMSLFLLNEYQYQLIKVAENRLKQQAGRLDFFSRTEPTPLLFTLFEATVILTPVIIWIYNPLSDWANRCELWLTSNQGLPPWTLKKLPLFFTVGWIAYFVCLAILGRFGLWRLS